MEPAHFKYGIVDGWPGTYWLKRTPNIEKLEFAEIKQKGKGVITVDAQLVHLMRACAQQCTDAYELMQEKRPIQKLDDFLSNVIGMHRATHYWLAQKRKENGK